MPQIRTISSDLLPLVATNCAIYIPSTSFTTVQTFPLAISASYQKMRIIRAKSPLIPSTSITPSFLRSSSHFRTRKHSHSHRTFSQTCTRRTDGVFKDLTAMRVPTPWIDALTAQRAGKTIKDPDGLGSVNKDTSGDLTPKHMSDSYFKVILPLGHDKSLADGYLNSEGNVRLVLLCIEHF
jgi:hypothetical protein